jgi:hypothetical protein
MVYLNIDRQQEYMDRCVSDLLMFLFKRTIIHRYQCSWVWNIYRYKIVISWIEWCLFIALLIVYLVICFFVLKD